MSTAIDLDDLEEARDEVRNAVMQILRVAVENPATKAELERAVYWLGSVHVTLERAIEAYGHPALTGERGGAS